MGAGEGGEGREQERVGKGRRREGRRVVEREGRETRERRGEWREEESERRREDKGERVGGRDNQLVCLRECLE